MRTVMQMLSTRLKIKCGMILLVAVIGAFVASKLPAILGNIVDGFATNAENLFGVIITFIILYALVEGLSILRRVYTHRLNAQFGEEMCNHSLWTLLRLPRCDLEGSGASGELTSKVNQAVSGASQLLRLTTNDVVPTIFLGIFIVWQSIQQSSPIFALIMLGYIVVSFSASFAQIKSQKGIRENIIGLKTKFDGEMCQSINGVEQIRALGAEDAECERLAPRTRDIRITEAYHHTKMGMYDGIKQAIKALFFCVILMSGLYFLREGQLTGGQIITVVMLFQQLLKPIDDVYRFLDEISASTIKVKIINELMGMSLDDAFAITDEGQPIDDGNVFISEYKVFAPSDDTNILSQGKDIEFRQGLSTAIVAKTGGGKSSLFKGLLRLYPLEGEPQIVGMAASKLSQVTLTKYLHYIPQSPFFFAGTVRENLAYGLNNVTDSDLTAALEKACLYNELATNCSPLDYLLQEAGKPLSGGQLKRMAIARAFLRTPRFYLMDEVFAGIDNGTATTILNNFETHAKKTGAGIVHVTHDENVISRCDVQIALHYQGQTAS